MIEIELPCCESPTRVETLGETVRCDACGIELSLADDEARPVRAAA